MNLPALSPLSNLESRSLSHRDESCLWSSASSQDRYPTQQSVDNTSLSQLTSLTRSPESSAQTPVQPIGCTNTSKHGTCNLVPGFAQPLMTYHYKNPSSILIEYDPGKNTLFVSVPSDAPDVVQINAAGGVSWRGVGGRFYCGRTMSSPCSCCDGICGPTKGCSCPDCDRIWRSEMAKEPSLPVPRESSSNIQTVPESVQYAARRFKPNRTLGFTTNQLCASEPMVLECSHERGDRSRMSDPPDTRASASRSEHSTVVQPIETNKKAGGYHLKAEQAFPCSPTQRAVRPSGQGVRWSTSERVTSLPLVRDDSSCTPIHEERLEEVQRTRKEHAENNNASRRGFSSGEIRETSLRMDSEDKDSFRVLISPPFPENMLLLTEQESIDQASSLQNFVPSLSSQNQQKACKDVSHGGVTHGITSPKLTSKKSLRALTELSTNVQKARSIQGDEKKKKHTYPDIGREITIKKREMCFFRASEYSKKNSVSDGSYNKQRSAAAEPISIEELSSISLSERYGTTASRSTPELANRGKQALSHMFKTRFGDPTESSRVTRSKLQKWLMNEYIPSVHDMCQRNSSDDRNSKNRQRLSSQLSHGKSHSPDCTPEHQKNTLHSHAFSDCTKASYDRHMDSGGSSPSIKPPTDSFYPECKEESASELHARGPLMYECSTNRNAYLSFISAEY